MESLDPARSAVLVVDVQRGAFRADPPPHQAAEVIARINALTARARTAGAPVIFIQHDGSAEDRLQPGSAGWELDDRLVVQPGDPRLRKTTCDPFYRTALAGDLRARNISHVVVAGYATEYCIDSTVRSATSFDLAVTVPADTHTTNDNPVAAAALIRDLHHATWSDGSFARPVRVCPSESVRWEIS